MTTFVMCASSVLATVLLSKKFLNETGPRQVFMSEGRQSGGRRGDPERSGHD